MSLGFQCSPRHDGQLPDQDLGDSRRLALHTCGGPTPTSGKTSKRGISMGLVMEVRREPEIVR